MPQRDGLDISQTAMSGQQEFVLIARVEDFASGVGQEVGGASAVDACQVTRHLGGGAGAGAPSRENRHQIPVMGIWCIVL